MAEKERISLRVGELAKRAGLSVRTLHFYDEIGLLSPAGRTAAGYRNYGADEILRLQQITSLRALGLPLERIKEMLAEGGTPAKNILRMHIADLGERVQEMLALKKRLESIVAHLDEESPPVEAVLRTIQDTNALHTYFTPEQIETLENRRKTIGRDRIEQSQNEWKALLSAFESAMKCGDDPASVAVQALARKSLQLVAEFSGSDAGIEQAVAARYRAEGASNVMAQYGWDFDQSVFDYMTAAMRICRSGEAPSGTRGEQ